MNAQVMLDLETLGNKPRSVIVAIGAVKFKDGAITDRFYERVDARSCVRAGLNVDVDTVMWWPTTCFWQTPMTRALLADLGSSGTTVATGP